MRTITPRIADFSGGEAIFPVGLMPSKYSVKMQNCHVSERGGVMKIPGYAKVNTVAAPTTLSSGFRYKKSDGTVFDLVAGGGSIYKKNGTALTAIKTGLDASAKVSFTQMNDICIMVNGVDAPMKFDGTTVSNLGGTPPATAFRAHVHKGRVWMPERTNKLLATHSALNNPEDYTTATNAGYIDFKYVLGEGDELVDIKSYIDLIVFVFRNHIVIYSGTNPTSSGDFTIVQKITGVGAVDSDASLELGTDFAIVHPQGVKSLRQVVTTGNLNIQQANLSDKIDLTIQGAIKASTTGRYSIAHYPALGWLLILIDNVVWIYSYKWKAWGRMVGADVFGMFNTDDNKLYLVGTGFLYEYGSAWSLDGAPMEVIWESAWLSFINSAKKVSLKDAEIRFYPGDATTVHMNMRYDLTAGMSENSRDIAIEQAPSLMDQPVTGTWEETMLFDHGKTDPIFVPLFGEGRTAQWILSNSSIDGPLELTEIDMVGEVEK